MSVMLRPLGSNRDSSQFQIAVTSAIYHPLWRASFKAEAGNLNLSYFVTLDLLESTFIISHLITKVARTHECVCDSVCVSEGAVLDLSSS